MLILSHAADVKSFGVSYLAPWSPLQWRELADGPVRAPFWLTWRRPTDLPAPGPAAHRGHKREDEDDG